MLSLILQIISFSCIVENHIAASTAYILVGLYLLASCKLNPGLLINLDLIEKMCTSYNRLLLFRTYEEIRLNTNVSLYANVPN